jgi:hypothetical protein
MPLAQPSARPSKITVPQRCHPLAKLVFAEMKRQNVSYPELEWTSNVLISTFKAWRTDNRPGLETLEAALGALGWSLVPVPRYERLSAAVREQLAAVQETWRREEPALHQLLAECCNARPLPTKPIRRTAPPTPVAHMLPKRRRRSMEPNPLQTALFSETVQ